MPALYPAEEDSCLLRTVLRWLPYFRAEHSRQRQSSCLVRLNRATSFPHQIRSDKIHRCSLCISGEQCSKFLPKQGCLPNITSIGCPLLPSPNPQRAHLRSCWVIYSRMEDKGMACFLHCLCVQELQLLWEGVSDVTKVHKLLNGCLPALRCVRFTELKSHYLDVRIVNLCCLRKST